MLQNPVFLRKDGRLSDFLPEFFLFRVVVRPRSQEFSNETDEGGVIVLIDVHAFEGFRTWMLFYLQSLPSIRSDRKTSWVIEIKNDRPGCPRTVALVVVLVVTG